MFTNNFYNFLKATMITTSWENIPVSVNGLININGNPAIIRQSSASATYTQNSSYNKAIFINSAIAVGTGTTPPALTDYELVKKSSNLNLSVSKVISRELSAENVKILYTIRGLSTNSEVVTITELGLYKNLINFDTGDIRDTILLARTLLPNPITVQPMENFLINYEIVI